MRWSNCSLYRSPQCQLLPWSYLCYISGKVSFGCLLQHNTFYASLCLSTSHSCTYQGSMSSKEKKSMWNNHPCPYKIAQYYQFFQRAGSGSVAITTLLDFILLLDAINRKTLWHVQIWWPGVYILVLHPAKKLYCFSFGFWNYELWVQGFLKICQLPSAYNYDNYWPVQKVKLIFMSTCFTLTICSIVYLIQKFFFFFLYCTSVGPLAWYSTSGHILCRAVTLSTYCISSCKYYIFFGSHFL